MRLRSLLARSAVVLAAGAGWLGVRPAVAQTDVAGVVIDGNTLIPLSLARVSVEGSTQTVATDAQGRFRLTGLSGTSVTIAVRRIGYNPLTRAVPVGSTDLRLALSPAPAHLDEVVVTGTAEAVQKRTLGNAISSISASDVVALAPPQDISNLINGKAPGVTILQGSGAVGAGARIKIRGSTSVSLNDVPLLYVDGVRVNNNEGAGVSVQGFSSGTVSRINDLDPESIESIEIIKGPAAATLYGTEASNGVIQIITKRGKEGKPVFNMTLNQGTNWFQNAADRVGTLYGQNASGALVTWNPVQAEEAHGTPLFKNGQTQGFHGDVSGGTATTQYHVGVSYDRDNGIEPSNNLRRFNSNLNLQLKPMSTLDISTSIGVTVSNLKQSYEGGGGALTEALFGSPLLLAENGCGCLNRGFVDYPPETLWENFQASQRVNRLVGSLQFNHRPWGWFNQRLTVGLDITGEDNLELSRVPNQAARVFLSSPTDLGGGKSVFRNDYNTATIDYTANAKASVSKNLRATTSVGVQYFRRRRYILSAAGSGFPAAGLENINATTTSFFAGEDLITNVTFGGFVQEQIDYKNRLFVTAALRADDNSAFGTNFNYVTYPKLSASWVIGEEPFFKVPFLSSLRLRAAYGETGQQPDAFASLRTYAPVTGGNGAGAVTPTSPGNPDLAPERGKELELGFDASLFKDKVSAEFTFYSQKTVGGLFPRTVAPSTGFPGSILVNTAKIQNRGIEAQVRAYPVNKTNFAWDMAVNFSRNWNKVLDLGGVDHIDIIQLFGTPRADQRHAVGYPLGGNWVRKVVHADLDANNRPITATALCDNGTGGTTLCFDGAGNAVAPRVYVGQTTPTTEGSFQTSVTLWKRLRVFALADFKLGQHITQNKARAQCQIFKTCLRNYERAGVDPTVLADDAFGSTFRNTFIEDASFAKLREISLSYSLPDRWSRSFGASSARVTLSARNLHTWTGYTGIDPETFFVGEQYVRVDQGQIPQLAQFKTTISLTF
ncbi:MAG: SusC/RagA family TonB-linked outer membrane protein [Gemmatimonadota bacterium]